MRNDKFPEPRHVPDPINLTLISEFYYAMTTLSLNLSPKTINLHLII